MKKLFVVLAFILFAEIMVNAQSDEEPGYFELIQQALDAKSAGAEDQALRLLYKATDVDSGRYPAYFQIGKIYFEKGLYEHAVKMFDRALKLRPEDYGSLYHKALAFSRQGRSGESAEVFGKINESYPSKTDYYYEYAWSCLKSYRIKKAEELALHLFKEKEDFYSSFLYANVLVFKEDYSGALNMYRSALEFSRKLKNNDLISLVYYNLAYLEKQFQNFDRAFEYIENSLSFTKRYTAYVLKGDIFLSTGDFEEAYTAYSTAYSISPVALTKLKMAEIFILQGKLDDAEMFLKHIDEAFNKDKISLYSLSVSIESFLSELNRMRRLLVRARFSHDKIFNRGGFLSGVVDWFDSLSFKASEKYYMNLYRKYLIKDGLNMVAFNDNVSGFISLAYANIEYKKIALKYFQKAKNSSEDDLRIGNISKSGSLLAEKEYAKLAEFLLSDPEDIVAGERIKLYSEIIGKSGDFNKDVFVKLYESSPVHSSFFYKKINIYCDSENRKILKKIFGKRLFRFVDKDKAWFSLKIDKSITGKVNIKLIDENGSLFFLYPGDYYNLTQENLEENYLDFCQLFFGLPR